MTADSPILVTRPFMPPLAEVTALLEGIWDRAYLTNNGPILREFEQKIAARNGMDRVATVLNGTIAIELALEGLNVRGGEVVTTPFTFPATSTAIVRTGSRPVFVDIDPETWNIDPEAVEKAIAPETQAILAVHVFGRSCDVERLGEIAARHKIKLIYDGAHANFIRVGNRSIFEYGDCSTVSFHATKLFHTVEGGACFSPNPTVLERIAELRLFGYQNTPGHQPELTSCGTNGKMTEVSAAVGLAELKYLDDILGKRRKLYNLYKERLQESPDLTFQQYNPEEYNYAYFPVLFRDESQLLAVQKRLNENNIFPRRYFWPLLTDMPAFADAKIVGDLSVAKNIASRILCLPLYPDLPEEDCRRICRLVLHNSTSKI